MKPICVRCERFMRPKKNGLFFLEGKPWGGAIEWNNKRGKAGLGWTPYKLWQGDVWACPDCGAEIIVGVGLRPWAAHHEREFAATVERTSARLLIKDC